MDAQTAHRPAQPRIVAAVVGTAAVLAVLMLAYSDLTAGDLSQGLAFVGVGVWAWVRRPDNRTGKLMIAYGLTAWAWHLPSTGNTVLYTLSFPLLSVHFALLWYTILIFPQGRVTTRTERVLLGVIVFNAVWQYILLLLLDPRMLGCGDCPRNLLHIASLQRVFTISIYSNPWLVTAYTIPIGILVLIRFLRASRPGRRILGPMLLPALALVVANRVVGITEVVLVYLGRVTVANSTAGILAALRRTEDVAILALAFTFLLGLARSQLRHARVSKLVVELGGLPAAGQLEGSLAHALGDPSLRVGIWDPDRGTYVREGEELAIPDESSTMVATRLESRGKPLALMVHDPVLLEEPGLVEATAAAARLAVENEQLQAEIRAQLDEVRASRQRIVAAQDEERRRIERDLHDGAQQRLLRLSMALQVAESSLSADPDPALRTSLEVAAEELRAALKELRDLARGIHPAVLTQRGLGAAIRSIAETAAVPVNLISVPESRLPPDVETAAYFAVSEALANIAKHAAASQATITARVVDESLEIEILDDGAGGASSDRGSGLRGLADRVQALDGELTVESPPGGGTRLRVTIPAGYRARK